MSGVNSYIMHIVYRVVNGTFNIVLEEKMTTKKEYLTERDLEKLGIRSAQTLRNDRWRGQNILPFVKIGKSIRYKKEDVLAYLERHTVSVSE